MRLSSISQGNVRGNVRWEILGFPILQLPIKNLHVSSLLRTVIDVVSMSLVDILRVLPVLRHQCCQRGEAYPRRLGSVDPSPTSGQHTWNSKQLRMNEASCRLCRRRHASDGKRSVGD